jgi:hypothetical protein
MTTTKASGESSWLKITVAVISAVALILAAFIGSPYIRDWLSGGKSVVSVPASQLEQELSKANIVLSEVDVAKVRTWLRSDPVYDALAQSCLKVLAGKRVRDPVPLDVINGRYREQLGYASDKYVPADQYGDLAKIEVAIFTAWKERHAGYLQKNFNEIVENISTP